MWPEFVTRKSKVIRQEAEAFLLDFRNVNRRQVAPWLLLPLLSLIIFALPSAVQQSLKLNTLEPRFWQLFTSSFVHEDIAHLSSNLVLYFISAFFVFGLSLRHKSTDKLNQLLVFTLLFFPVFSAVLDLYISSWYLTVLQTSCGASGIVSVILGFIPIIFLVSICPEIERIKELAFLCWLYLLSSLSIKYPVQLGLARILALCVLFISCAFYLRKELILIIKKLCSARNPFVFTFNTASLLFFLFGPAFLLPLTLISPSGGVTNIITHLLGVVVGVNLALYWFTS